MKHITFYPWINTDDLQKINKEDLMLFDQLEVNDIVVDEDGDEKKVLEKLTQTVLMSRTDSLDEAYDWYTKEEIGKKVEEIGWHKKGAEEVKEMTVEEISKELGYEVKVVKNK